MAPEISGIWRRRYCPARPCMRLDIDDIAGRERAAHAAAGPAHAVDRQNAGLALARHLAGFFARRLQTDASLRLAGVEHHREPPRLHVAERRNRRELRSPVGRNVDVIHGAAKAMRLVEAHEAIRQRLARERLNFWIERGADGQTAFVELLLAVTIEQFAPNLLGEIASHVSVWREHARVDAERLRLGLGAIRRAKRIRRRSIGRSRNFAARWRDRGAGTGDSCSAPSASAAR